MCTSVSKIVLTVYVGVFMGVFSLFFSDLVFRYVGGIYKKRTIALDR